MFTPEGKWLFAMNIVPLFNHCRVHAVFPWPCKTCLILWHLLCFINSFWKNTKQTCVQDGNWAYVPSPMHHTHHAGALWQPAKWPSHMFHFWRFFAAWGARKKGQIVPIHLFTLALRTRLSITAIATARWQYSFTVHSNKSQARRNRSSCPSFLAKRQHLKFCLWPDENGHYGVKE